MQIDMSAAQVLLYVKSNDREKIQILINHRKSLAAQIEEFKGRLDTLRKESGSLMELVSESHPLGDPIHKKTYEVSCSVSHCYDMVRFDD